MRDEKYLVVIRKVFCGFLAVSSLSCCLILEVSCLTPGSPWAVRSRTREFSFRYWPPQIGWAGSRVEELHESRGSFFG